MIHTYRDEDVARAISWREVLQDLPAAFESLRSGDAAIQARQRIDCGSWKLSGMGALWESRGVAAYKTYTSLNGQFDFLVNLFDLARQDHHVMPAAEITRARTAAMTAWVARKITRLGARKMALFGLGIGGAARTWRPCRKPSVFPRSPSSTRPTSRVPAKRRPRATALRCARSRRRRR